MSVAVNHPRMRVALVAVALFAASAIASCDGRIDDGWDGLSAGGDTDALSPPGSPPGSKCVGYDAGAWSSEPACQTLDDCIGLAPGMVPPGWPSFEDVGCGTVVDSGSDARVCQLFAANITSVACTGTEGTAYCQAWALQYAKQAISVNTWCKSAYPQGGYFCVIDNTPCPPCEGICVQRANGWHCETPCQDPGDEE